MTKKSVEEEIQEIVYQNRNSFPAYAGMKKLQKYAISSSLVLLYS